MAVKRIHLLVENNKTIYIFVMFIDSYWLISVIWIHNPLILLPCDVLLVKSSHYLSLFKVMTILTIIIINF